MLLLLQHFHSQRYNFSPAFLLGFGCVFVLFSFYFSCFQRENNETEWDILISKEWIWMKFPTWILELSREMVLIYSGIFPRPNGVANEQSLHKTSSVLDENLSSIFTDDRKGKMVKIDQQQGNMSSATSLLWSLTWKVEILFPQLHFYYLMAILERKLNSFGWFCPTRNFLISD